MTTVLYSHDACFGHNPHVGHPECPERLSAILSALDAPNFKTLKYCQPPLATVEQIVRVHDYSYVTWALAEMKERGAAVFDNDTYTSVGSYEAALRAAGSVCAAIDSIMAEKAKNAFCAIRPPGHHATYSRAMGFCFFNNVAVGAAHARCVHGLERVAVIDFDVHHGNGTQAAFWNDPNLFFGSTHQSPLYPGTGDQNERGVAGNVINVPLKPCAGSEEFRNAMENIVFPALREFSPDLLLISAGFDAHSDDPLASLNFIDDDYYWVTNKLCAIAAEYCQCRLVSTLEGGYHLESLGRSAAAHVAALIDAG